MTEKELQELQLLVPDHPDVRVVLWHQEGLKRKGMAPELWLTEREQAEVKSFGSERRRREWTAARIALKSLLVEDGVVRSPLSAEIRKNGKGQPRIVIYEPDTGRYEELTCSLAHKNSLVVAAYSHRKARVGVDIEKRSWRLPRLRRRFESESDRLLPSDDSIGYFTILWALKEAVSKLLGTGFACGFQRVECLETRLGSCEIKAPEEPHLFGLYVWQEKYVVAIVTDVPAPSSVEKSEPASAPSHPWYQQISRAKRLRSLRRSRALAPEAEKPAEEEQDAETDEEAR